MDSLAFAADGSASIRTTGDSSETLTLSRDAVAPFLSDSGRAVQTEAARAVAFRASTSASPAQPYVPCALIACVALTFDDGPSPDTTPDLLDILRDEGVRATFFVEGRWASAYPDLIRREVAEGHSVENHTWDHPDLATLPADRITEQITSTDQAIVAAGVPRPTLIRAPYGSAGGAVAQTADRPLVFWSIDAFDWRDQQPGVFVPRVLDGIEPGGITLMHDIYPTTVAGQRLLIGTLRDRGYTFVTVPQLYAGAPLQAGVTYSCLGDGLAATGPACTVSPVSRTQ
jgi:peptidoglycan/xylan/chitin deacetylase (PgdA/CDA1 family)